MTSDVLHSSSSAENLWEEAESRIAEATMIRIWQLNVTEVCQAVFDSVFHVEEGFETKKKIERAFEIVLSWCTIVDKNIVLFLDEQQSWI